MIALVLDHKGAGEQARVDAGRFLIHVGKAHHAQYGGRSGDVTSEDFFDQLKSVMTSAMREIFQSISQRAQVVSRYQQHDFHRFGLGVL